MVGGSLANVILKQFKIIEGKTTLSKEDVTKCVDFAKKDLPSAEGLAQKCDLIFDKLLVVLSPSCMGFPPNVVTNSVAKTQYCQTLYNYQYQNRVRLAPGFDKYFQIFTSMLTDPRQLDKYSNDLMAMAMGKLGDLERWAAKEAFGRPAVRTATN